MMKLISAVIAAALFSGSTLAADLSPRIPVYASSVPVPPPWTGFYTGVNLGGGSTNNTWNDSSWAPSFSSNHSGVVGGGQIGFSAQIAPVIAASLETDFQGTGIGSSGDWGSNTGARLDWFGTVRGRLGFLPMQNLLAFGTGGFAYGELQGKSGWLGFTNWNSVRTGWTAGGGFEWMFIPKWSAKIEYLYSDLGTSPNSNVGWSWINNAQYRFSTVRAGVNWHFNLFVPPPSRIVKY